MPTTKSKLCGNFKKNIKMEYRTNLKELFLFESKSVFGRLFLNRKPKLFKDKNYLNLGCGSNIIEGYINADFFKIFQFLKKKIHQKQWQLDLKIVRMILLMEYIQNIL